MVLWFMCVGGVLLGAGDAGECSALPVDGGPYARRMAPELARSLWDGSLHCGGVGWC